MTWTAATWTAAMLRDLKDWCARRPLLPPEGGRLLTHSSDVRMVIWAMTGIEVVTAVVVDAMIPPAFRPLHIFWEVILLVLCLGFCAMTARAPHVIEGGVLRLRTGPFRELIVPLAAVKSLRIAHGGHPGRGLRRVPGDAGGGAGEGEGAEGDVVAYSVSSATSVVLELIEPLPVRPRRGGCLRARWVHFAVDEPGEAVRAIRQAIDGVGEVV
ncbi:hypothetical protein [Streptomyces sp. 35G-GA-8]|uniref:hypothetical protein n=1 Tax=Streptomyces sp. 35G-GA-8 TaxID=2939434 RepID=UPI00201ECDCE|nr:hypothetical protein [Streptomyces sp. 35G-GA-8]MCL7380775.1 hypothetical protein [Streptomyces sp. 35G-GA-8]